MKIGVVNNVLLSRNFWKNKKLSLHIQKVDTFEMLTFKGRIPDEIQEKIPFKYSIYDLISNSQTKENLRGTGANSKIYDLLYLEDYVLKVLNKNDPNGVKYK